MQIALVVNAYNRPDALARLLSSLQQAAYPEDVPVPLTLPGTENCEGLVTARVATTLDTLLCWSCWYEV